MQIENYKLGFGQFNGPALMTRPQVLFLGDRDWPEFAAPVQWLIDHAEVSFATEVTSARVFLHSRQAPFDLVVVAQHRPGEHLHATFDDLRALAPLSPIVCLLASFCEGEMRTGRPWPGAVRVYAHQFVSRLGAELARQYPSGNTTWAPPFTATDEDRLVAGPQSMPKLTGRAAVISRDRQMASALCDALQAAGALATSYSDQLVEFDDNADIIVWDCSAGFAASRDIFDRLVQDLPEIPKVALLGFPRAHDIVDAMAHGACAVISKPFLVEDLLWQLHDALCLQERLLALD
jgi:CheY-like chemotaxis protein